MAAIIPAAALSGASRQLRRPGAVVAPLKASAEGMPAVPVTPVTPAAAVAPQPSELQRQAGLREQQSEDLRLRERELALASAELQQRQTELAQREQQLQAGLRQLTEEVTAIKTEAERHGLEQGRQQGEREAQEAVRTQVERLNGVVRTLQQAKRTLLEENQDMLVEIAYAAVCRVLGSQLVSRGGIAATVGVLVDGEHALDKITVRLHPQDAELMVAEAGDTDARLLFQADTGIELGGCIVDSPRGTLDARLELQLRHLREALIEARKQRGNLEAPI